MKRRIVMETGIKRGFTFAEALEYLGGISRPTMYRLLGDGALASYRIGIRRYFTKESLDKFIDERVKLRYVGSAKGS
jgi:excisionase family DNA binding protein